MKMVVAFILLLLIRTPREDRQEKSCIDLFFCWQNGNKSAKEKHRIKTGLKKMVQGPSVLLGVTVYNGTLTIPDTIIGPCYYCDPRTTTTTATIFIQYPVLLFL